MKITDVRVYPVSCFVYVVIETDAGLCGLGEASLSGRRDAVVGALQHLRPVLVGRDATRIEHIWQDIFRGTFWRGGPVLQSALAGVDIALWDLNGKALGAPVHRLLGGLARDRVRAYRHCYADTPAGLVERARGLLDEGWQVLRISPVNDDGFDPGRAARTGVEHMAALRAAVGPDVEIIFEVHTRLTPAGAVELCRGLAPHRPYFVEDPIRSENPASFAHLRAHADVPLGTGEQLHTKWEYRELVERELIDYLRVDLCHTGGITEARKIAALAEVHYQELATHYTSSPVSTAAMLHLNLGIPNCAVQEHAPPDPWMEEVISTQVRVEDGHLLPTEVPGLGVEIDELAAAAHVGDDGEPPHLRRADGSVQDW